MVFPLPIELGASKELAIDQGTPFEYLRILEEVGADPNRVAFSHTTRTFPIPARHLRAKLADKGAYLEYGLFGKDGYYPIPTSPYIQPNDGMKIQIIKEPIEDGFLYRILISHDIYLKVELRSYGGQGYSFILDLIVPEMLRKGMAKNQIETIMVRNPKKTIYHCLG